MSSYKLGRTDRLTRFRSSPILLRPATAGTTLLRFFCRLLLNDAANNRRSAPTLTLFQITHFQYPPGRNFRLRSSSQLLCILSQFRCSVPAPRPPNRHKFLSSPPPAASQRRRDLYSSFSSARISLSSDTRAS